MIVDLDILCVVFSLGSLLCWWGLDCTSRPVRGVGKLDYLLRVFYLLC